jgi:hypothetical protein
MPFALFLDRIRSFTAGEITDRDSELLVRDVLISQRILAFLTLFSESEAKKKQRHPGQKNKGSHTRRFSLSR